MIARIVVSGLVVVLAGCGSGKSENPVSENHASASGDRVCRSGDEIAKSKRCLLTDVERVSKMSREIALLPQHGPGTTWYSVWFDLKTIQKRYLLSRTEVNCLKQQFCI